MEKGFTLQDLHIQKLGLEDRIRRIEGDLKAPLDSDFHEQAAQLSNQIILRRLLEAEKANLEKVTFEISRKEKSAATL